MRKTKAARLAGFALTAGATVSLAGFAVSSTGAYFSESHAGSVNASTGGVHATTTDLTLDYTHLLPGQGEAQTFSFRNTGTAPEDFWLVLPTNGAGAFDGPGGSDAALGRYGHFLLNAPAGSFDSYNLAAPHQGDSGPVCPTDVNGHGGSSQQAATTSDYSVAFCPVPDAILLASAVPVGTTKTATLTFGFTKLMTSSAQEDSVLSEVSPFKVVATQQNIRPDDPNVNPNN